jgi:hypothetical protein
MPNSTVTRTFDALINKVGSEKKAKEINLACEMYYEYLYKDEYHATVQKVFIESLDNRLLEHKKKVIWFHCDENSLSIPIKSGPCLNDSLYNISIAEPEEDDVELAIAAKTDSVAAAALARKKSQKQDKRLNHFNNEDNRILSELILDVIRNDSFTSRLIRADDYFFKLFYSIGAQFLYDSTSYNIC